MTSEEYWEIKSLIKRLPNRISRYLTFNQLLNKEEITKIVEEYESNHYEFDLSEYDKWIWNFS